MYQSHLSSAAVQYFGSHRPAMILFPPVRHGTSKSSEQDDRQSHACIHMNNYERERERDSMCQSSIIYTTDDRG